jgi:asparagine synthase (glutamine-hydrolysing)
MSGIAGIYHTDGRPVDSSLLYRMIDCVPHRGADGIHVYAEGSVGLAHRQLCSTEESLRELQPASNPTRSCWVTFDGRIDNREELIDRLHGDSDSTDVDLMLRSYEQWGTGCLAYLLGDFAFALWDSPRHRLFCARDHYGIRPFYYRSAGADFFLGSEVRQILQNPDLPLEVNEEAVAEWFTAAGLHALQYRDLHQSFFKGIQELPPAHYLVVDRYGLQVKRYWDLDPKSEVRYRNRQEYFDEFSQIFSDAVRCRLRSRGPVGAELSGGFDSSSIVCVAQELLRQGASERSPLIAFSMVFDELSCDERPLSRSVIEKYSIEFCPIIADDLCGLSNLPSDEINLRSIDQPDQFALQKAGEFLYRTAYERNVRVMLSGEGAENHVMGSEFVLDSLIRKLEWAELFRRLAVIKNCSSWKSSLGKVLRYGLAPLLPRNLSLPLYFQWFHPEFTQDRFPSFYTAFFCSLIQSSYARQKERLEGFAAFAGWARQLEYENLNPASSLLRPFCQPVERRFPYHDRRLVEYCLSVPPEIKYQHVLESQRRYVRGRVLQKEAFRTVLPETIRLSQMKVNFNDLYRRRFVEAGQVLRDLFQPPAVPRVSEIGFLDAEKFWQTLSRVIRGFEDSQPVPPQTCLWVNRVVQLELWLQVLKAVPSSRAPLPSYSSTREAVLTR